MKVIDRVPQYDAIEFNGSKESAEEIMRRLGSLDGNLSLSQTGMPILTVADFQIAEGEFIVQISRGQWKHFSRNKFHAEYSKVPE